MLTERDHVTENLAAHFTRQRGSVQMLLSVNRQQPVNDPKNVTEDD